MALTLYYAPGACSLAPHVALEETQARFETVRLNLADGDQRGADYLAINPKGRVPTLIVDGRPLTEVIAIITYIHQRFPEAGVLPSRDPLLLARTYEVMTWLASTVHIAFAQITRPHRYVDDSAIAGALAQPGKARFLKALSALEELATSSESWLIGETFTAADAYALVIRRWAERIDVDLSAFPAWSAKGDKALERPSVIRALAREAAQSQAEAA